MNTESGNVREEDLHPLEQVVKLLQRIRDDILSDWVERVRENRAVRTGRSLSEPLLLDHVPQLFDSMISRLDVNRSREETEQWAAIHGFSRRVTGYDVVETAVELSMLRRSMWNVLTASDAPMAGVFAAMERIDGMLDRALITSLQAFLDPSARMLIRRGPEEEAAAVSAVEAVQVGNTPL
jgi:hypothetical protein